jgi:hypothetical protein
LKPKITLTKDIIFRADAAFSVRISKTGISNLPRLLAIAENSESLQHLLSGIVRASSPFVSV